MAVEEGHGGPADDLPAPRTAERIDSRLQTCNPYTAGDYRHRTGFPGYFDAGVGLSHIGESGQEPDHVNAVGNPTMEVDDFFCGHSFLPGNRFEVGRVFPLITDGDADIATIVPERGSRGPLPPFQQPFGNGPPVNDPGRVVKDRDRTIGNDPVDDPLQGITSQPVIDG